MNTDLSSLFVVVEPRGDTLHHFWMKSFPSFSEAEESAKTNPKLHGQWEVWTVEKLFRALGINQ